MYDCWGKVGYGKSWYFEGPEWTWQSSPPVGLQWRESVPVAWLPWFTLPLSQHHLVISPGRGCGYYRVYPVSCVYAPGALGLPEILSIWQNGAGNGRSRKGFSSWPFQCGSPVVLEKYCSGRTLFLFLVPWRCVKSSPAEGEERGVCPHHSFPVITCCS